MINTGQKDDKATDSHNILKVVQVVAALELVPYFADGHVLARVPENGVSYGEDVEVAVNTNRACTHDGTKEGNLSLHCIQKSLFFVFLVDIHDSAVKA